MALSAAAQACQLSQTVLVRNALPPLRDIGELNDGRIDPLLVNLSDYALLAATSYDKPEEIDSTGSYCPVGPKAFARWERLDGYSQDADRFKNGTGRIRIPGLGFLLWRERGAGEKTRLALVFRGTDVTEWGDWYSNVRWLTRLNPTTWDQYAQTRDLMQVLIPELDDKYGKDYELIAIGHSLGGGLAQHAAYMTRRIRAVYAFATSPVTAVTSIDPRMDKKNREGLNIYRTYEAGEILSGIRWTARQILPLRKEDPKITELRFNFRTTFRKGSSGGGPLGQHKIRQLACDLICRVDLDGDDARCNKDLLPSHPDQGNRSYSINPVRLPTRS